MNLSKNGSAITLFMATRFFYLFLFYLFIPFLLFFYFFILAYARPIRDTASMVLVGRNSVYTSVSKRDDIEIAIIWSYFKIRNSTESFSKNNILIFSGIVRYFISEKTIENQIR